MKSLISSSVEQIPETLPRAQADQPTDSQCDVLVVGAGPTGMACAIEAQKAGFKALIVDKGCLVNSIYHYPNNMVFFTTPELLEIGDIPFTTALAKPTRLEALEYYRRVAEHYELQIRQYEWVKTVMGKDGDFRVTTTDRRSAVHDYRARKIILATGYYDLANQLEIPGEDLEKVFHYYRDPHPYYDADVLVIGGKNSAAEAALDLLAHDKRGQADLEMLRKKAIALNAALAKSKHFKVVSAAESPVIHVKLNKSFSSHMDEIKTLRSIAQLLLEEDKILVIPTYYPDANSPPSNTLRLYLHVKHTDAEIAKVAEVLTKRAEKL